MPFVQSPEIARRAILTGSAALAMAVVLPRMGRAAEGHKEKEYHLVAKVGRLPILGESHPETNVWCYNDRVPGPEIRVRQGERIRIVVDNHLAEETTVHWHGIRLPNDMDGVPGLTQPPIRSGESFVYEFTPPDAGTFWYHPHANTLEQLGRGMAGAFIVEEPDPVPVDRDIVWMLSDWRLTSEGQLAPGFGNAMEAAMSGRVGNTVTLNGFISTAEPVRAGERVRLRLINGALARIMALRFEGHRPVVVAVDGQPCDPHEPDKGRIVLGPAMRIDVVLDMHGEPGRRYRVVDDFYEGLAYWLTHLSYGEEPPSSKRRRAETPLALPPNPLPEPILDTAVRYDIALQGGMMGGGAMEGVGGTHRMAHDVIWSINGTSMTGDGHAGMPPLVTLERGRTYVLAMRNETAWWHPMHLHGFSFRVLARNGITVPHRQWADTVLLAPRDSVDVAFVADTPGDWMFHCHVTDHQVSGMMTVLRVT